ncbi:MAG: diaminopimelate decarboxylase [Acidimicrobiales bacterium]
MNTSSLSNQEVFQQAVQRGLIGGDIPLAGFINVDGIRRSTSDLHEAFSRAPRILHSFAAKANSLVPVLRLLREFGMGCEVASAGELAVALAAGFAPDRIVLDAPTKTRGELSRALSLGVATNLDNLQEVARVSSMLADTPTESVLGVRVNPQVGGGSIAAMSTATTRSKFGVASRDAADRELVIETFRANPWLTRLHAHVGSQGCPLPLIAEGLASVYKLAKDINAAVGHDQVTSLDLGGGLPVNFDSDEVRPTFADYVAQLASTVPEIFDGEFSLVTEFGRSILAKNGFLASTVEYTKEAGDTRIALTHAGGQVATRTVFMPDAWPIRVTAHGPSGAEKTTDLRPHDIGGPLCFAGDLVARDRVMPGLEPDDFVVLHDTGAYYFSCMWSYNVVPNPPVYGYCEDAQGQARFVTIRPPQTLDEVVAANAGALQTVLTEAFGHS